MLVVKGWGWNVYWLIVVLIIKVRNVVFVSCSVF